MAACLQCVRGAIREISRVYVIATLFVVSTLFASVLAVAAGPKSISLDDPTAASGIHGLPDNVPQDYVVTPNGFFHPSCVQRVESDETLRADGTIVRSDGSTRRVQACTHPHFAADGTQLAPDAAPYPSAAPSTDPPQINGWVAYASYTLARANASVYIASNMSVPDAPAINSGQVVYFFPGLEDAQHVQTIVQPVLGWNAFNDSGWTIASWNCCLSGQTWHSPAVAVDSGATLFGQVSGSNCDASVCTDWTIVTSDPVNDHDTTLNTSGYGQAFDWVFGAVLEAYGISQCGELPQTTNEEFSHIVVYALSTPTSRPRGVRQAWGPTILANSPDCGYTVTPHPQPNAPQITIKY